MKIKVKTTMVEQKNLDRDSEWCCQYAEVYILPDISDAFLWTMPARNPSKNDVRPVGIAFCPWCGEKITHEEEA